MRRTPACCASRRTRQTLRREGRATDARSGWKAESPRGPTSGRRSRSSPEPGRICADQRTAARSGREPAAAPCRSADRPKPASEIHRAGGWRRSTTMPAGTDSYVLLRRPDVVEAEYQLRAANARHRRRARRSLPAHLAQGAAWACRAARSAALFSGGTLE